MRLVANLDCEAAWAGVALPAAVRARISLVGALFAACAPGPGPHEVWLPAPIDPKLEQRAREIARGIATALGIEGLLCVELFLVSGDLLVNELAPRPHNSGHLTIDAHTSSQFEQQVRAVCGLPLGSVEPVAPAAAMANLLGDLWDGGTPDWRAVLASPGTRLHLYGKEDARPGRKMGHLTALAATPAAAEATVREARAAAARAGARR